MMTDSRPDFPALVVPPIRTFRRSSSADTVRPSSDTPRSTGAVMLRAAARLYWSQMLTGTFDPVI